MRNAHPHTAEVRRRRIIYFELGLILALSSMLWAFNLNFEPGIDLMPTEVDPFEKEWDSLVMINIEEEVAKQEALKNEPVPKPSDLFKQVDNETPLVEPDIDPNEKLGDFADYRKILQYLPDEVDPYEDFGEILNVAQTNPMFPGGEKAMMFYIRKNTKYPSMAKENNIQGRVVVTFVVEKDGTLSNFEFDKDPGFGLAAEAIRVVKSMPRWTPGEQNFHPVRVRMRIPFFFRLE